MESRFRYRATSKQLIEYQKEQIKMRLLRTNASKEEDTKLDGKLLEASLKKLRR